MYRPLQADTSVSGDNFKEGRYARFIGRYATYWPLFSSLVICDILMDYEYDAHGRHGWLKIYFLVTFDCLMGHNALQAWMVETTPLTFIHQCHQELNSQGVNGILMQVRSLDHFSSSLNASREGCVTRQWEPPIEYPYWSEKNSLPLIGFFPNFAPIEVVPP